VDPGLPLKVPYGWIEAKYSFMADGKRRNNLNKKKMMRSPTLYKTK
jgi:hypothetical protein